MPCDRIRRSWSCEPGVAVVPGEPGIPAVYEALRMAVGARLAGLGFCLRAASPETVGALKLDSDSGGELKLTLIIDSARAGDSCCSYEMAETGESCDCIRAGVDMFCFS